MPIRNPNINSDLPWPEFNGTLNVPCYFCGAAVGFRCTKATSGESTTAHRRRWDSWNHKRKSSISRFVLLDDDERMKLSRGDILIGKPYWLDPYTKTTILYRESDGFDPECNQYNSSIRWLGWKEIDA